MIPSETMKIMTSEEPTTTKRAGVPETVLLSSLLSW